MTTVVFLRGFSECSHIDKSKNKFQRNLLYVKGFYSSQAGPDTKNYLCLFLTNVFFQLTKKEINAKLDH